MSLGYTGYTIQMLIEDLQALIKDGAKPSTPVEIYAGFNSFTGEEESSSFYNIYQRVGKIVLE